MRTLNVADGIPYARQPMGDEGECGHEQKKNSGSIFRVTIEFPSDSYQSQKASRFQQTDESSSLKFRQLYFKLDLNDYHSFQLFISIQKNTCSILKDNKSRVSRRI